MMYRNVKMWYQEKVKKFVSDSILTFHETMNNAKTYTDIVITQEPANDLSPLASWSVGF
jgi:hypothetical protein